MCDDIAAAERAYWIAERRLRLRDAELARMDGSAPFLVAAAELRLREAEERLSALHDRSRPPVH